MNKRVFVRFSYFTNLKVLEKNKKKKNENLVNFSQHHRQRSQIKHRVLVGLCVLQDEPVLDQSISRSLENRCQRQSGKLIVSIVLNEVRYVLDSRFLQAEL